MLARVGAASLGAHQIAFQLFVFLALVLDAIAIAGQVMVGRMLGAGDPDGARAASVRMIGWSVVVGQRCSRSCCWRSADVHPARVHRRRRGDRARARDLAAVRRADAARAARCSRSTASSSAPSDTRYLMWSMLAASAVYVPLALLALHQDWGIQGVWAGLAALFAVRLLTLGVRFLGQRWALTGAPA